MANHSVWLYPAKFSRDHLYASGRASVDSRTCLHDPRLPWRGGGLARSCEYKSGSGQFTLISGPLPLQEFLPPIGQLTGDFNFGRSYSMQIPGFWYKPLAAFNSLLVVGLYFHRISWNPLVS